MGGSESLASECGFLVSACLQLQIADEAYITAGMQLFMNLRDHGEDDFKLALDIGTRGMGFEDKVMALQQFDDMFYLLANGNTFTNWNDL